MDFSWLKFVGLNFDAADGAGGGGGSPVIERAAVTDLGGGAPAGGEPDIFEGADDGAGGGDDASPAEGDEPPTDDEPPADEPPAEGDEPPADEDEPPADEDPDAKPADGKDDADKTPEEKAAEAKAAKEAAEKAKKPLTEEEKQIEATLQEAYRNNPKLKAALKQFPELRGEFFRAASINKLYPGGIKEATQAKEYALELYKIDNMYYGRGPESKREFINFLWNENLDANGKSTGHYEQLAELMVTDTLGGVEQILTQNPAIAAQIADNFTPAQAATSIEVVRRLMSIISGKPIGKGADASRVPRPDLSKLGVDTTNMTPREKRLAEELANERARNEQFNKTSAEGQEKQFYASVYTQFETAVKADLDKRIPDSIQSNSRLVQWFGREVREEIQKALQADDYFVAQLESAARSGDRGPQHIAELAGMMEQRAKLLLPAIARKVSEDFSLKPKTPQSDPNNRQSNKRVDRTRTAVRREPPVGGAPGRLTKPVEGRRSAPARPSGVAKTTGDYNRDANKLLGLE